VDASVEIGTGHVMRCLTLAGELTIIGFRVIFLCRCHKGHLIELIENKGYQVIKLNKPNKEVSYKLNDLAHSKWLGVHQDEDAEETRTALKEYKEIDLLIVDHYSLDNRWEKKFRNIVNKIFVIDDLADRKHDCDLLLDQNYYPNMNERYKNLINHNCNLVLGPRYALLRREFRTVKKKVRKYNEVKRIMIFLGGSDFTNQTTKAIQAIRLLNRPDILVDVVLGASNPFKSKIEKIATTINNLNFHYNISNMASLMVEADLAIGAGGSTNWERCYLGLPAITVSVADNQSLILECLDEKGAIKNLGWYEKVTPEQIADALSELVENPDRLKEMSKISMDLMERGKRDGIYLLIDIIRRMT
jgi:UDP-2,4-diacetamido-2,4,6-trideoxy-beta-L-altropyranose hydrolase